MHEEFSSFSAIFSPCYSAEPSAWRILDSHITPNTLFDWPILVMVGDAWEFQYLRYFLDMHRSFINLIHCFPSGVIEVKSEPIQKKKIRLPLAVIICLTFLCCYAN